MISRRGFFCGVAATVLIGASANARPVEMIQVGFELASFEGAEVTWLYPDGSEQKQRVRHKEVVYVPKGTTFGRMLLTTPTPSTLSAVMVG